MPYAWPEDTDFALWELEVLDRDCPFCGRMMYVCDHRYCRVHTLDGPVQLICKLNHCPDPRCTGHAKTKSPELEVTIALPKWAIGWEEFRRRHRRLRGVYLIHDGGPSHISGATAEYLDGCHGWWRPRLTPARASWLDQAELLIHAFGTRYLKRSSWHDRDEFIQHVADSWPEYNERYAHPFEWTWTNQKMRSWFVRHGG